MLFLHATPCRDSRLMWSKRGKTASDWPGQTTASAAINAIAPATNAPGQVPQPLAAMAYKLSVLISDGPTKCAWCTALGGPEAPGSL